MPHPTPAAFGEHDDKTLAQLADVAGRAEKAALMADGHLGYVMPIGSSSWPAPTSSTPTRTDRARDGWRPRVACGTVGG